MSLTVTVQKGHDFSSGNVTRAALNAGAVPTVAVTGSVGTSELGADAVTATEIAANAVVTAGILNANVTTPKIADGAVTLPKMELHATEKGVLVKTGDTADPGTTVSEALSARGAGKIPIGTGTDLLSLGHDTAVVDNDSTTAEQPSSHVGIAVNGESPPTGIWLTMRDYAIKAVKLAKNKVGGTLTPGVIVYDNNGVASVLASTGTDSKVLTTNNTATPSFKVVNKKVDLLGDSGRTTFGTSSTAAGDDILLVQEHGLSSFPTSVSGYLECTQIDKSYAVGDKVNYLGTGSYTVIYSWDSTKVYAAFTHVPTIPDKVATAQDATITLGNIDHEKWKVVALVSE